MANTYTQIYIQIVYAVNGRKNLIRKSFKDELEKFIAGIITNRKQKLYAIYAMPDHVHILVSMSPNISVSDLARDIKAGSSKFVNDKKYLPQKFSWQAGFGAFSYSKSHLSRVVNYILNQEEHHKKKSFKEEYLELLEKFEIEFDEKYLFRWIDESSKESEK